MNKVSAGLTYLHSLPLWSGGGNFTLAPISRVLKRLGDPQDAVPTIHVAGTNGKGSVSCAVASILGQAGYRVGLNTSPHLTSIHERMVIDGLAVSNDFLGDFAHEVRAASERAVEKLSYHEALTAIAFLGFREFGVEWSVIEVGLGGRLDASNVIKRPIVSTIVTIDFDHQHVLGDTIAKIAAEKAGIIKRGCPQITGALPKEAFDVVARVCREVNAPHSSFGQDFGVDVFQKGEQPEFHYWNRSQSPLLIEHHPFRPALPGVHQGHNMGLAMAIGNSVGVPVETCIRGVEKVRWPGRLEHIEAMGATFLLDCAHNPAGIRTFMSFLDMKGVSGIDLSFGALETKNWREMLEQLAPRVSTWRLLRPDSNRALALEEIETVLRELGSRSRIIRYDDDYERYLRDLDREDGKVTRYVTGSMYMVGKLRGMLGVESTPLWERTKG